MGRLGAGGQGFVANKRGTWELPGQKGQSPGRRGGGLKGGLRDGFSQGGAAQLSLNPASHRPSRQRVNTGRSGRHLYAVR